MSSPRDLPFYRAVANGEHIGLSISYEEQKSKWFSRSFVIGEFIAEDNVCLVLGDNIFTETNFQFRKRYEANKWSTNFWL